MYVYKETCKDHEYAFAYSMFRYKWSWVVYAVDSVSRYKGGP